MAAVGSVGFSAPSRPVEDSTLSLDYRPDHWPFPNPSDGGDGTRDAVMIAEHGGFQYFRIFVQINCTQPNRLIFSFLLTLDR